VVSNVIAPVDLKSRKPLQIEHCEFFLEYEIAGIG
jgi:hypothetical protein